MAARICAGVFALRLDRRQPGTSARSASGKPPVGRSRIPSPVSSTVNSVPGPQALETRMFLGRIIWPLVESRVVSIGKTPVRLWHNLRVPLFALALRLSHGTAPFQTGKTGKAVEGSAELRIIC